MSTQAFMIFIVGIYVIGTLWLSYIGMRKTKGISGFSIGNKDMSPILVGITLAASVSSTATFVVNPGFVYTDGLSAFIHYGVASFLGIFTALVLLSKGFRRIGENNGAITIPNWIYHRYGSRALSLFFAALNLLSITFVVLILVGCSIIMSSLFGIDQKWSLIITLLFVFSYVLMGGTYAHAYTNTFQGIMMLLISVFLFMYGMIAIEGGFFENLNAVSENYASFYNPDSKLYYNFFSTFIAGFVVTFGLMMQPHILTKVLYLKSEKDVSTFLATSSITLIIFYGMLFVGFFARFSGLEIPRQDEVVTQYLQFEFAGSAWGAYFLIFISVTLLAAGMSTLDGILVALSAMVVKDVYMPFAKKQNEETALNISRWVLVVVGLISFALAWNPPKLVGLFAQAGLYGLTAAVLVPILFGVLYKKKLPLWIVTTSALLGISVHLTLYNVVGQLIPDLATTWGFVNPGVTSTYAVIISISFAAIALFITNRGSGQIQ